MSFEIPEPIELNYENGSSAFVVDIRGSSQIVRELSYSVSIADYNAALLEHTNFMMRLFKCIFERIEPLPLDNCFSFNDTGDGCLCVFWDNDHPLTCLRVAAAIHEYLLKDSYAKENKIRFGIGLHTGGSLVYRTSSPKRDYVFGIVANTAARVEKFTKNLKDAEKGRQNDPRLIFTGNFKHHLQKLLTDEEKKKVVPISEFRLSINDGKNDGHFLYTLPPDEIAGYAK